METWLWKRRKRLSRLEESETWNHVVYWEWSTLTIQIRTLLQELGDRIAIKGEIGVDQRGELNTTPLLDVQNTDLFILVGTLKVIATGLRMAYGSISLTLYKLCPARLFETQTQLNRWKTQGRIWINVAIFLYNINANRFWGFEATRVDLS